MDATAERVNTVETGLVGEKRSQCLQGGRCRGVILIISSQADTGSIAIEATEVSPGKTVAPAFVNDSVGINKPVIADIVPSVSMDVVVPVKGNNGSKIKRGGRGGGVMHDKVGGSCIFGSTV